MRKVKRFVSVALPIGLMACGEAPPDRAVKKADPLAPSVAAPGKVLTFARTRTARGQIATLLITGVGRETVRAIDVAELGAPAGADAVGVVAALGEPAWRQALETGPVARDYSIAHLLSSAGEGTRHIATGTNFREHAREVEIGEVFNFPKLGRATSARTVVPLKAGALLDYEVEICARFDRDILSVTDFDAAQKGFFLCGDLTDRARLMRLVDPQNIGSGRGFSDANSGIGFFPTGPFLVIPSDWRAFVRAERVTTEVDGKPRQDARGGEMILDFRALAEKALTSGGGGRYTLRGAPIPLLTSGKIARGAAIMSGTPDGVIFRPPRLRDYVSGGFAYIFAGPMLRGEAAQRVTIDRFIEEERLTGRFL